MRMLLVAPKKLVTQKTVLSWYDTIRTFLWETFESTGVRIGGPGMMVEIDETAISRRKYNVGRISASNTQWLVGGICRETGEIFLERVPNRSQATLNDLVVRHVETGTTIITDCWAGYNGLVVQGFPHDTVNHSIHFLNPSDNNINTQRIEKSDS
uniref:DDE_Tnp_IS1595 domain-containing protein n=1 Tax=Anopheles stephensi TaxID=30069 RepID=A0A182YRE3_ANOST